MNRRSWMKYLPAFLLPAVMRGQQSLADGFATVPLGAPLLARPSDTLELVRTPIGNFLPDPMPNGMCPVCGTVENPYKRSTMCVTGYERDPSTDHIVLKEEYCDPPSRNVRCRRCNASFWQDAE